ncbi:MAG: ribosome small subunit-dependent GTPase A [Bacillota bacterium]|nr:ribosome small subunit-dependent GTPase A [Bacillota bacterium]
MQPVGLVMRTYSNYCDVRSGRCTYRCQVRGRLKLDRQAVLTGDQVVLEFIGGDRAMVTGILPRRTALTRPPIANADLAVIVFTAKSPPLNLGLVDRLLILARSEGLATLLCLNKTDLAEPHELALVERHYGQTGYELVQTSAKHGHNLGTLVERLQGRTAVLAGQSGVGKSTLLNAISPGTCLEVGELSPKVQRGRHTTRGVRLIPVGDGLVADTPGFVALELPQLEPRDLAGLYPEMAQHRSDCRFPDCIHDPEPGCAVKDAVERGEIDSGRYRRYLEFLHELQARRKY